jgi:F-type H+-transporting ATPase subunit epsilon
MAETFPVDVVAADRRVWQGRAAQGVATTVTGEIGILAHHIPLIAALAPGRAEITVEDGRRLAVAVAGGFLSVAERGETAIISPYAQLADEISLSQAERDLRQVQRAREDGDLSLATERRYHRALAQVRAAARKD